ncbi:MAG: hypothetical protein Q8R28_07890 [Dehalococcoidia bacterium]|nr:hypothetical protein [Dehalococcoidia bacterium]
MDLLTIPLLSAMGILTGAALALAGHRMWFNTKSNGDGQQLKDLSTALASNTSALRSVEKELTSLIVVMREVATAEQLEMQRINDIWKAVNT